MIREYFANHEEESTVVIEDGQIKALKSKNITSKSIRVFDEKNHIFALSAGVGDVSYSELEAKALDLLSLQMPFKYDLERDVSAHFVKDILTITDIEAFTQRFLDDIYQICPDFVLSGNATITKFQNTLRNDLHLDLSRQRNSLGCGIGLKLKGSGSIDDAYTSISGFDISPQKYDNVLKSTELLCNTSRSKEVSLADGTYKILFVPYQLLGKMESDICGEAYETKSSLLAGRLGEQIFHENITLIECHDSDEYETFVPYDHEGIIRKHELPIIENGILKNILYDKKTANKFGKTSTGNGFRHYNANPTAYPRTLIFPQPSVNATSLIADDTVIVPVISSGGDFLPNGNYSLPIQLALVFKNGVFAGKAPQLSITGNYLETLNKDFICICKNDILKELMSANLIFANAIVTVL